MGSSQNPTVIIQESLHDVLNDICDAYNLRKELINNDDGWLYDWDKTSGVVVVYEDIARHGSPQYAEVRKFQLSEKENNALKKMQKLREALENLDE